MSLYEKMYVITEDEYMRLMEKSDVIHADPIVAVETPTVHTPAVEIPTKTKHKCKLCDREYSDKRDLKRHIKKFHLTQMVLPIVKKIVKRKRVVNKREPFIPIRKKWMTLG